jgi:hypothetical protein
MAVREALQKNRFAGPIAAVVLLAFAATMVAYTFWPSGPHASLTGAFYSDDEGQSYYSDNVFHFPPFDHDGKTSYRAVVYSSKSGNFVGLLERYTPETKKMLEDGYAKVQSGDQPRSTILQMIGSPDAMNGIEFKTPGSGHEWSHTRPFVKAPDGGDCMMVMP